MNKVVAIAVNIPPRAINSGLCICLCITGMLYMYFISMTVVHVVVRKEVTQETSAVTSSIASLEAKYITAQHEISKRIADETNLSETSDKIFVSRTAPSLVLREVDGS